MNIIRKIKQNLFFQFLSFILLISLILTAVLTVSLFSSRRMLRENAIQMNDNTLMHLNAKIDEAIVALQNAMSVVSYNPVVYSCYRGENSLQDRDNLKDVLINTLLADENIEGISLYDMEGHKLMEVGRNLPLSMDLEEVDTIRYSDVIEAEHMGGRKYMVYYPIYDLKNVQYFTKMGICVFCMSVRNLDEFLEEVRITEHAELYLVDTGGRILVSNGEKQPGDLYLEKRMNGAEKYYISEQVIKRNGWRLVSRVPIQELYAGTDGMDGRIQLLYVFSFGVLAFMVFFCYHSIIRPLQRLSLFVRRNPTHTSERTEVENRNEIGTLADNMNRMLDERDAMTEQIQESQKKIYETQLAGKQMEILAYRNQINPHFLYNTLECIRAMALYHDCDDVAELTVTLSNVLRYAVKGGNMVRIAEEVDYIREYAKIIDCRFFHKIQIMLDCQEDVLEKKIVRLILQPLVENAVFHGLEPKLDGGNVRVGICLDGEGTLLLQVEDDGLGIGEERLEEVRRSMEKDAIGSENGGQSVGLVNIYQRLRLIYGRNMDMLLESERGKGTRVMIRIREQAERHERNV